MNYQFDKEYISQHVVKYGVDVRPPIILKQDKTKLQDYCNALIEQCAEMPTFILTARGPLFTFPQRLYIDGIQDFDIPQKDKIFRKALDELRAKFIDRAIPRVGVVHEFVFDTGQVDSVQILASNFKNDVWRERTKNLRILLETPMEEKNINVQIRPTQLRRITRGGGDAGPQDMAFGIIVNVDINNRNIKGDLTSGEVRDIVAFANDYVPEELIKFLNNEY